MTEPKSSEFRFSVKRLAEAPQLESDLTVNLLDSWLKANDSITPQYLNRGEWNDRGRQDFLEKSADGKLTLVLPTDLKLWEVVQVVEEIDSDTFAKKPEKQQLRSEALREYGHLLADTGAYIYRFAEVGKGVDTPEQRMLADLAEELFSYGNTLESAGQTEKTASSDIQGRQLSAEKVTEIDQWLAGDQLMALRKIKAEQQGISLDEARKRTLLQFARILQTADTLNRLSWKNELKKPTPEHAWSDTQPMHRRFLNKMRMLVQRAVEQPKAELFGAISRRGHESLLEGLNERTWKSKLNELGKSWGIDLQLQEQLISESLNLPQLKEELAALRAEGDLAKLARKEWDIVIQVQRLTTRLKKEEGYDSPAQIVDEQTVNCVGATSIAGAILSELGINYLVLSIPLHSATLLLTSDNSVYEIDYLFPQNNKRLEDHMIQGQQRGKQITTQDIISFSQDKTIPGLNFIIDHQNSQSDQLVVDCYRPGIGQEVQLLINIMTRAAVSQKSGLTAAAMRLTEQLVSESYIAQIKIAQSFMEMGIFEYAVENATEARRLQPLASKPYEILSYAYLELGRFEDAKDIATTALEKFPRMKGFNSILIQAEEHLRQN